MVPTFILGTSLFGEDGVLAGGDFDVVEMVWFGSGEAGGKSVFGCGEDQNYTGYCQRLVTSDLDEAERILEPEARARVLQRADLQLAKDVPVIPLYQVPFVIAYSKALRNVVLSPFNPLWKAENWWLER